MKFMPFYILVSLLVAADLFAGEVSLFYSPNNRVQYEGVGYRQQDSGWELKTKPAGNGAGLRVRHALPGQWGMTLQYWTNLSFYEREDGNAQSHVLRQTGQTELTIQNLLWGVSHPIQGSLLEAVFGVQGTQAVFRRKDFVFNGVFSAVQTQEEIRGAGGWLGVHGAAKGRAFFIDGEVLLGHYFLTSNKLSVEGGGVHQGGYSYLFILEAGVRFRQWRFSAGFCRQLMQIHVPGGKSLGNGATVSFPINKLDFSSPFIAITFLFNPDFALGREDRDGRGGDFFDDKTEGNAVRIRRGFGGRKSPASSVKSRDPNAKFGFKSETE